MGRSRAFPRHLFAGASQKRRPGEGTLAGAGVIAFWRAGGAADDQAYRAESLKIGYHHAMVRLFAVGLLIVSLTRADTVSPLRGINAFNVVVEDIENAPGLTDEVQTDVELRCREAGIKLGKPPAAPRTGNPLPNTDIASELARLQVELSNINAAIGNASSYLYINVQTLQLHFADGRPAGTYAVALKVEFRQLADLERDPTRPNYTRVCSDVVSGIVSSSIIE